MVQRSWLCFALPPLPASSMQSFEIADNVNLQMYFFLAGEEL